MVDAVYIALGVSTRSQWALRAIQQGKHVLLETPCAANEDDARSLFDHPSLRVPGAPVLLEVAPFRFHRGWTTLESLIDRDHLIHVRVTVTIPACANRNKDLCFRHEQSGDAKMDLTYGMALLRAIYDTDPTFCNRSQIDRTVVTDGDFKYVTNWQFPNGGFGEVNGRVHSGLFKTAPDAGVVVEIDQRPADVPGAPNVAQDQMLGEEIKASFLRSVSGTPLFHGPRPVFGVQH